MNEQPSGAEQLREWIERRRCETDKEAARVLRVDHTYLSQILSGRRTPGLLNAVKIERATGIAVEAWLPTDVGVSELVEAGTNGNRKRGKA